MQSRGVAAGAPSFQELFQYPDLADDVERSLPIEAFLRLLAEVAADGRELVRTACAAFLARHRSARDAGAAGAPVPATVAALRQRIAQGLQAHAWQGAALGFVEYVLDFFERFEQLAGVELAASGADAIDVRTRRMLVYLGDLGLIDSTPRRIVEFCASNEMFGILASHCGHRVVSTDIGKGAREVDAYGFGAKVFLRTACFGVGTVNYALDRRDLSAACARRWFEQAPDVLAIHGTHLPAGERLGTAFDRAEIERAVGDVVRFVEPALRVLARPGGALSLRHVTLFKGFDDAQRIVLAETLREALVGRFGVALARCGTDPFPTPWVVPEAPFTFSLVARHA